MSDPKDLLLEVLRAKDASRSRSTQKQIGPSELGFLSLSTRLLMRAILSHIRTRNPLIGPPGERALIAL